MTASAALVISVLELSVPLTINLPPTTIETEVLETATVEIEVVENKFQQDNGQMASAEGT